MKGERHSVVSDSLQPHYSLGQNSGVSSLSLLQGICTYIYYIYNASPVAQREESVCQCRRHRRHGFNPWVRKIPWRRKWQPIPVFLPEKSHRQSSLVGYIVHRVAKRQTWLRDKANKYDFIYINDYIYIYTHTHTQNWKEKNRVLRKT